jgi:hypothetical protein
MHHSNRIAKPHAAFYLLECHGEECARAPTSPEFAVYLTNWSICLLGLAGLVAFVNTARCRAKGHMPPLCRDNSSPNSTPQQQEAKGKQSVPIQQPQLYQVQQPPSCKPPTPRGDDGNGSIDGSLAPSGDSALDSIVYISHCNVSNVSVPDSKQAKNGQHANQGVVEVSVLCVCLDNAILICLPGFVCAQACPPPSVLQSTPQQP